MTVFLLLVLLILMPLGVAFLFQPSLQGPVIRTAAFRIGTPIVYRQDEVSNRPISGARDVHPAEHGEYYYCSILNYLRVIDVLADGRIVAVARNQKCLCFWPNDSSLRKARLTERLLHPSRFPHRYTAQTT